MGGVHRLECSVPSRSSIHMPCTLPRVRQTVFAAHRQLFSQDADTAMYIPAGSPPGRLASSLDIHSGTRVEPETLFIAPKGAEGDKPGLNAGVGIDSAITRHSAPLPAQRPARRQSVSGSGPLSTLPAPTYCVSCSPSGPRSMTCAPGSTRSAIRKRPSSLC